MNYQQLRSTRKLPAIAVLLISFYASTGNASAQQQPQKQNGKSAIDQAPSFMDSLGGGKPISLYAGKVPNSKQAPASYKEVNDKAWSRKVTDPEMIPFLPDAAKRTGT